MALKLPTLLEGEVLVVWLELTEKKDYEENHKPMSFISLDDFHKREPEGSVTVQESCTPFLKFWNLEWAERSRSQGVRERMLSITRTLID